MDRAITKQNDLDPSIGSPCDTSSGSKEPSRDGVADEASETFEACYKPEMGTIIVNELPRDDS